MRAAPGQPAAIRDSYDAVRPRGQRLHSGALGQRSVLDTPFSNTVVTAADLRDRQARKLGDVFALDAAVTDNSAAYGVWGSYLTVRGLPVDWQNGYRIDGNPFISYFKF